jgi:hypothetical protein
MVSAQILGLLVTCTHTALQIGSDIREKTCLDFRYFPAASAKSAARLIHHQRIRSFRFSGKPRPEEVLPAALSNPSCLWSAQKYFTSLSKSSARYPRFTCEMTTATAKYMLARPARAPLFHRLPDSRMPPNRRPVRTQFSPRYISVWRPAPLVAGEPASYP